LKVDRYAKDLFKKLDNYNFSSGNGNEYNDGCFIEIGSEPPRFTDYREARAKTTDAFGNKTCEDVWDSITQDELDYYLKMNLRRPPEERYQHKKEAWYFHESSWYMRHDNGYDGYGCNYGVCVPECRYYPQTGRIEDEEVIESHNEYVERLRQKNAIVEPPSESELLRLQRSWYMKR
jgi:hypothetical protein